ncbi:reverse transcriptase family protein [Candidatus Magnetomorum sp. HK-1]|nr:reverse transcriptase family protein [Candidatus Magnetomorum sp. HK-1]
MKRTRGLYSRISEYNNICDAFCKAAKGKHHQNDVITFKSQFDKNIQDIRKQLINKKVVMGNYYFFLIHDPKLRSICAASFPERVLHHAIMNICEPILEKYAIYDSYACRKGKGTHRAIYRVQSYSKKYDWYLKLDIRRYFDSIDHFVMIKLLSKRFKDNDLILLFQQWLDTYHTDIGKGVPIGSLLSQHFANYYMSAFDHWIKRKLRIKGYLRYMDDFLLFSSDKEQLKDALINIQNYLYDNLSLKLKDPIQLNKTNRGIPFLGFRVYPVKILLNHRSKTRFSRKFIAYEKKWVEGQWSDERLLRNMNSLIEFTKVANAEGYRQRIIDRFGVPS